MWKTVVITGGCGFIGSNVVEALLDQKLAESIVVLDNYTSGKKENEFADERVRYVKGDTWDILELLADVKPDIVMHFGEFSRIVTSFDMINYVFKSNGLGTQRVCEYCVQTKAKLLYSGSSSIFGNDGEDSNLSPYAFLKKVDIQLIKNYSKWFGLSYALVYFYKRVRRLALDVARSRAPPQCIRTPRPGLGLVQHGNRKVSPAAPGRLAFDNSHSRKSTSNFNARL